MTPLSPAKRGLIPASPSKGQDHEPSKGGTAQSIFSTISDVVGEGFTCLIIIRTIEGKGCVQ
ncbi:MAG: hypothetical protein DRG66_03885 [Deltaproteobacteria bacterium]|nr:MAG: hypothetical protein DRG66_03885 [Deltaproteobacteria bacterium]